ncbi:MAG: hypothetical protein JRD87_09555 [Deltaproteobacteria bacterium]|jgi:hypothetical protein|nr:hypothetical protein [Deltaproteobacteria bacterium]MBW2572798.1 hypothetical protein [Deltaproteobacteria bacterium]MBW2670110.1 hypothetical protein [Deltaproteobacteria bacterium]MBW2710392.1 hypothetical protein [Deltaproteobacteria bacterium]
MLQLRHRPADTANLETVRWLGLLGIIVMTVAVIFKLTLPPPKKRD